MIRHRAWFVAFALAAACGRHNDAPVQAGTPVAGRPLAVDPGPGLTASDTVIELSLAREDSVIGIAPSHSATEAMLLMHSPAGGAWVERWRVGDSSAAMIAHLSPGFVPRSIAAHPAGMKYFISGRIGDTSQILSLIENNGTWTITPIFKTSRDIGPLIVSARPFQTDSGGLYRLFFAANLPRGGSSLRTVTERGRVEYQVVGPASEQVAFPDREEDELPGGLSAQYGLPLSFHPRGQPLLWQDAGGCTHEFLYDRGWDGDKVISEIPCDGITTFTPNGNAYLHWVKGRAGIAVIGTGVTEPVQAKQYEFLAPPASSFDGRAVFGVVATDGSKRALAYVPIVVPLGDIANAWQRPTDACDAGLFAREGGLFLETRKPQLYSVYDRYNYSEAQVPFLVTTDLFWDNFGAAFNGVFIVLEKARAIDAFWAFADTANQALARGDTSTKWARAFAAIAQSRNPNPTGDAAAIVGTVTSGTSAVEDRLKFDELKPRGHYTSSAQFQHYFRAVHYLTEIAKHVGDATPLAGLPAPVHRSARRWIETYLPFIAAPRMRLVWAGATAPGVAPYAKYGRAPTVFPLSWGLDNEVLNMAVYDSTRPEPEQIKGPAGVRAHPSGIDVATVYGNRFARALLGPDLKAFPTLGPVLDAVVARRPTINESSSVYERWLDALGAEWADALKFPGAPEGSRLWNVKRLQTGLASWATLREATILVNERPEAAEGGEGGFEQLLPEQPRGYVEPVPKTFEAIAKLYESLARVVDTSSMLDRDLSRGLAKRLNTSAEEARRFGAMADLELHSKTLADSDYAAIQGIAGLAEHEFLLYKGLANTDEGLPTPDPMAKIADVAGNPFDEGTLEIAVGNPLEWRQVVPYFGRREIVVGATYSYHEFVSHELYDNERWRKEVATHPHPAWVQPLIAPARTATCGAAVTP